LLVVSLSRSQVSDFVIKSHEYSAAVLACLDVTIRASMLMDAGDYEALVGLLMPDFEFVRPSTFPEVSIKGALELHAAMCARPSHFLSRHVCTNQVVDLTSDKLARVRSYFVHYSGMQVSPSQEPIPLTEALRSVGEYDDTVVQTAQGWRIARRVGRFIFGGV
jgi:hypothetical protein